MVVQTNEVCGKRFVVKTFFRLLDTLGSSLIRSINPVSVPKKKKNHGGGSDGCKGGWRGMRVSVFRRREPSSSREDKGGGWMVKNHRILLL